jgi:hypothetical protein
LSGPIHNPYDRDCRCLSCTTDPKPWTPPSFGFESIVNEARIAELEAAIRKHREAKGHERCWENDVELYSVLKDNVIADPELPPQEEFFARCQEYYQCQSKKRTGK